MTKKNFDSPESTINCLVARIDHVLKTVDAFGEDIDFDNFESSEFNGWRKGRRIHKKYYIITPDACLDTLLDYDVIKVVEKRTEKKLIESRHSFDYSYRLNNGKTLDASQFRGLIRALGKDDVMNLFEPVEINGKEIEVKIYTYGFNHDRIATLRKMRESFAAWSSFDD